MTATLRDVARLAGVSFKTVSNVVNGHPSVAPATRTRVLQAIEEAGYRPNRSARRLRSGRSGVIALAVPALSHAYFAELADDVITAARRHGLDVVVHQTGGDAERERRVLDEARDGVTDGLLFSPLGLREEDAAEFDPALPLVLLGERILGGGPDHVTMENVAGARAMTSALLDRGRRRIAVLGARPQESTGTAGLRLTGYRAALAEHGVGSSDELIVPTGGWTRSHGAEAARRVLDAGADAIFAITDELALGALRALADAGVDVPGDVAVAGFDDIEEARFSTPRLSTVDAGRARIADLAVETLVERIGSDEPREGRLITTPFAVVERESTGA